jgi:fumarate hydratase class II
MEMETKYRIEKDTMGEVRVPADAYYGAQTQRAVENFPVSGFQLPSAFIHAQAIIKRAAAMANMAAGKLETDSGNAIVKATDEVIEGKYHDQFVVDVYQAGAGTSQNMNINEVLANRANEILGGDRGKYVPVHPNDHVNMGQSTNDTIPTAIHVATTFEVRNRLLPVLDILKERLLEKSKSFDNVVKSGRTHLQDAVPIRLGQEFGGYARIIELGKERIEKTLGELRELCIGGSAVGTGLNTDPDYRQRVVDEINQSTGYQFEPAANTFEAMQSMDKVVAFSGALRALASGLTKIADDLRLLSSGPTTGLAEIKLPSVQPGSSIMPGKVNPVLVEMMNMVCYQVFGCDTTILHAARSGQLELNVMMPVIAYNILFSIDILANGIAAFTDKCVIGIEANREVCLGYVEHNPALATALNLHIGYARAAELAKRSVEEKTPIRQLVLEEGLIDEDKLAEILDVRKMTELPEETKDRSENYG